MKRKRLLPIILALLLAAGAYLASQCLGASQAGGALLTVRFLDVGQADAALITCGESAMLIDGGLPSSSSFLVAYLKELGIDRLDYIVCTHAHEDHMGGLSGPLNTCTVGRVLAPVTQYPSRAFESFVKYTALQGLSVEVPAAGDRLSLGGAEITVLGPVRDYEEVNDTSLVLRIDFGKTSFLFTGDMERPAEADLLDSGAVLPATVLKVGHNGSDTSTSYPFLRAVMPTYAVISVGKDNSYGHPDEATLSRLRDAGCTVYRTDLSGTVTAVSDGEQITFSAPPPSVSASPSVQAQSSSPAQEGGYIGNRNSQVFHAPSCPNLPAQRNRVLFESREDALSAGYTPCGNCAP